MDASHSPALLPRLRVNSVLLWIFSHIGLDVWHSVTIFICTFSGTVYSGVCTARLYSSPWLKCFFFLWQPVLVGVWQCQCPMQEWDSRSLALTDSLCLGCDWKPSRAKNPSVRNLHSHRETWHNVAPTGTHGEVKRGRCSLEIPPAHVFAVALMCAECACEIRIIL